MQQRNPERYSISVNLLLLHLDELRVQSTELLLLTESLRERKHPAAIDVVTNIAWQHLLQSSLVSSCTLA